MLAADFEDTVTGLNHPVYGATPVTSNVWHHAAATYDGTTWRLYLDGVLDATLVANAAPRSDTTQKAGLGAMLKSDGTPLGHFQGLLDEVRVWNVARSRDEIAADINHELISGNGLVARWGMSENYGTTVFDSITPPANGTITGAGTVWAPGAPFNLVVDLTAPLAPAGLAATGGNAQVALTWTANAEPDMAGYNVYRSTTSPVEKSTPLNGALLTSPAYTDSSVTNGTLYFYAITAVDTSHNESDLSGEVTATPQTPPPGAYALDLGSNSAYVTFGDPAKLDLAQFTIETWFKRTGPGTSNTTGTSGIPNAIPLVTHGSPQGDGSNVDANWILAIDDTNDVIAADFEDMAAGLNHPVYGTTAIANDVWHHAAATYDGATWRLYLDGRLETTLAVNATPRSDTIQRAGLGTMIESGGATHGHFQGVLDEVRVWNAARTQGEIQGDINRELESGTGLVALWGMSEGWDAVVHDSVTSPAAADGAITGTGFAWVQDAPFNVSFTAPAAPTNLTAAPAGAQINLAWADNSNNESSFEVERSTTGSGGSFTLLATVGADITEYSDSNVIWTGHYCYRVRATNVANSSAYTDVVCETMPAAPNKALDFGNGSSYVTFGDTSTLGLAQFTIETWFRRDGAGSVTNTGSGGLSAVPLITKGMHESDGSNVDMNYFMGIDSSGVLAADFEDAASGANHPVKGVTPIQTNTWYHAAVTYNGAKWQLFLNGNLETELAVGQTPRSDSIQHAGLAVAMNSTGVTEGHFDGALDEVRIWNVARTETDIRSTINSQITESQSGLVGRWSLNEGAGTTINGSAGTSVNGMITGSGYSWPDGAPFDLEFDSDPPAAPTGLMATGGAGQVSLSWTANAETDVAGYNVYRSTSSPVTKGARLNAARLTSPQYVDSSVTNGTPYHYAVTAVDRSGNESLLSDEASATPHLPPPGNYAIDFGSGSAHVTFGDPAKLDLAQFTIETWFMRTGMGTPNTTGTNGIASALPLVTHGSPQTEGSSVDENWILAIDDTNDVIAADFEDMASGANHPVYGTTKIANGVWHHAAATYDGATWRLYLDGSLETTLGVTAAPRSDTIQHAALGTMIDSEGAAHGHFQGVLDEVRIWNVARTEAEIVAYYDKELIKGTGLVARWALNEGYGTTVADAIATPAAANGALTGTGASWVTGAPLAVNHAPDAPALGAPADKLAEVSLSPELSVTVSDLETDSMTVTFYGKPASCTATPNFTLVALPDTQNYTTLTGGATTFNAQTQWVVDNRSAQNIVYVAHLGDITESGDTDTTDNQWVIADTAMSKLEMGTSDPTDDVPFGLVVGNHDVNGGTARFENHFGVTRFSGRSYYGGHYGSNNVNSYTLFNTGGLKFIMLNLQCTGSAPPAELLTWADGLLKANADRRAIVTCHELINTGNPGTWVNGGGGQAVYEALKGNPNLFLMLGGHVPGEGQRQDTYNGNTVYSLLSDYQSRTNGGNGWLRVLQFLPSQNQIQVKTYSPTLGQYETDADSQFTLTYDMQGCGWQVVSSQANVASGSPVTANWPNLVKNTRYEWYVTASDGGATTTGATWSFTTKSNVAPVASDQSVTTPEDTAKAITLSATDADGDPLTYAVVTGPAHGTLTGTAPNLTYTPAANYNGPDSFTFKAKDPKDSNIATVSITVTPVNDPPVAVNDGIYSTNQATKLTVAAVDGLLKNDTDVENSPLTVAVAQGPAHGSLILNPDGSFDYTPTGWYAGSDSFTYRASDGTDTSTEATVSLDVVNTRPAAPTELNASLTSVAVKLTWKTNPEGDIAGYNIYRSASENGSYTQLNTSLLTARAYTDPGAPQGTSYYRVKAVDAGNYESADSAALAVQRQIIFRAASTAGVKGTSLTIAKPTGVQAGDLLLAVLTTRNIATTPSATGWNLGRSDANSTLLRQTVLYKVATAGEPNSYSFSLGSSSQVASGVIVAYTGADTTTPVAAWGGPTTANSASVTAAAVSAAANSLVVGFFSIAASTAVSPPTAMIEQAEVAQAGGKDKVTTETADLIQALIGSTGSQMATANAAAANIGRLIVIAPAGTPPPTDTEKPSVPQNLAGESTSSTRVYLTWSGSTDNFGVTGYTVFRDGSQIGTTTLTNYADTTAKANTTYAYTVDAYDAAGNHSTRPTAVSVTTPPAPAAGIHFRAASTAGNKGGTTLVINRPAGVQAGDVLVASIDVLGQPAITAPTGWTLIGSAADQAGNTMTKATYWRKAVAQEPTSYTWTFSSKSAAAGVVQAYSGVDPTNPIDRTDTQVMSTAGMSITAPTIDVQSSGAMLLGFFGIAASASITPPSGMTERGESTGSLANKTKIESEGSDKLLTSAGATGSYTATASQAGIGIGRLVALRPAQ